MSTEHINPVLARWEDKYGLVINRLERLLNIPQNSSLTSKDRLNGYYVHNIMWCIVISIISLLLKKLGYE